MELSNVWKKYQMGQAKPLVVLKDINLKVYDGEFLSIVGPSGSGKSTIMHILGILDTPSWGKVFLRGKKISGMKPSSLAMIRGRTIGFIFQKFNLLPNLTALQNVMIPLELNDVPDHIARRRATELLRLLGLGERMNHKPNELSGGQQQRVAIARSLANDPDIILADEPTGNLDSKTGEFVIDFLAKMNKRGKTVILITHDQNLVRYSNRIIFLKDGKVEKEEKVRRH